MHRAASLGPARRRPRNFVPGPGSRRWLPWAIGGAAVILLAVLLLAGVVFKMKTAAGTLVVEVDQTGAEVTVDGKKVTISSPGAEPITVDVDEGNHQLTVVKGGFETYTRQFKVKSGEKEVVKVRLEPTAQAKAPTAPAKEPTQPAKEPTPPLSGRTPENTTHVTNSIRMNLASIPAGKFAMGSPRGEYQRELRELSDQGTEELHDVEITTAFFMGVYEVTQEEYEKVMGTNPSFFSGKGAGQDRVAGFKDTGRFPVESVSWNDAVEFCRKLSASAEEKRPVACIVCPRRRSGNMPAVRGRRRPCSEGLPEAVGQGGREACRSELSRADGSGMGICVPGRYTEERQPRERARADRRR